MFSSKCGQIRDSKDVVIGFKKPSDFCLLYTVLAAITAMCSVISTVRGLASLSKDKNHATAAQGVITVGLIASTIVLWKSCHACRGWKGFFIAMGINVVATIIATVISPEGYKDDLDCGASPL